MDILFLLSPNFTDGARDSEGKRYYCPSCAFLEGVLHYCPELREKLDIRYIDFPRPRREIIALVGDANQGCPNLVLDPANHAVVDASRFYRRRAQPVLGAARARGFKTQLGDASIG